MKFLECLQSERLALPFPFVWWVIVLCSVGQLLSRQLRNEWCRRIKNAHKNGGIPAAGALLVLSMLASPLVFIYEIAIKNVLVERLAILRHVGNEVIEVKANDIWLLVWVSLNAMLLLLWNDALPLLIFLPFFRLVDLLYVFLFLLTNRIEPKSPERALFRLVFHYSEVVIIFACWFLYLQHVAGPVFSVGGKVKLLSGATAFYYSLITAATVGYGDITPSPQSFHLAFFLRPSTFIGFEMFCMVYLTAIEIPRVLSRLQKKEK